MPEHEIEKIYPLFDKGLVKLGIELPDELIAQLVRYGQELIKWNRKINLVAKKTSFEDIVEKHFLDSLTILPVLQSLKTQNTALLDIGSGAGFPGLVIKTADPLRPVTLLEPRQRRVSFLNHIVRVLKLKDVEVCQSRTDELAETSHPRYGIVTGRAVADVKGFLEMIKTLAEPGCFVICMQGVSGPEQWEAEHANDEYSREAIIHTRLPFSQAERSILIFKKR